MQGYFGERGHERANFDQASAILDSNSEEAWGETKKRVRLKGEVTGSNVNMAANLRSRAPIRKRLQCRLGIITS